MREHVRGAHLIDGPVGERHETNAVQRVAATHARCAARSYDTRGDPEIHTRQYHICRKRNQSRQRQIAARVQPVDSRSTAQNAQARTQCDATCGRRHEGRLHEQHHAHEHVHAGAGGDNKRQGRLPAVPAREPRGSDTQTKRNDVQSIMPPEHMFDHIKAARMALTMPHQ